MAQSSKGVHCQRPNSTKIKTVWLFIGIRVLAVNTMVHNTEKKQEKYMFELLKGLHMACFFTWQEKVSRLADWDFQNSISKPKVCTILNMNNFQKLLLFIFIIIFVLRKEIKNRSPLCPREFHNFSITININKTKTDYLTMHESFPCREYFEQESRIS